MPRFSIKDLLIATTLIAIGLGLLVLMFKSMNSVRREFGYEVGLTVFIVLWIAGIALIVAGFYAPFTRVLRGLVVGSVLSLLMFFTFWLLTLYANR